MSARRYGAVLALLLSTGCATTRAVRLDTGQGDPRVFTASVDAKPVELDDDEFEEAVRALSRTIRIPTRAREEVLRPFSVPGHDAYSHVRGRLGLVFVEEPSKGRLQRASEPDAETELASAYQRWCGRKKLSGDCLHLLDERITLDEEGKRTLAFRFALDSVWDETAEALKELTNKDAVIAMLATTGAVYLGLWLVPEPLLSKGLAATLTVALIAYLGWDTVWSLVQGWRVLAKEVKTATTFDEVRDAGERYGEVMGKNAARAFIMLAMTTLGATAELAASRIATLPGSSQAALAGVAQGGFRLGAAGQVAAVAVSSGGVVTIALPPGAVAMKARGTSAAASEPVDADGPEHHIATDKFGKASHNGGPWTPKFQEIFDRAGMSLDDPANKVRIPGHKGPHPQEYHEEVYRQLQRATSRCRSMEQCRQALTGALRELADELVTRDSWLNKLVTMNG